ncbi:Down-regulated in metastasis [Rhizoctonia solani]|uniref:Down-regulated in metastasis n=1 Tax=Rhizoctonia solani TaxID=456999 RepID=A0A8H7M6H9_9AGAM|nr:Down-regulated in metastasis [Rhizoctonia solani]
MLYGLHEWVPILLTDFANGASVTMKRFTQYVNFGPILPGVAPAIARIVALLHDAQTNDLTLGASIIALVELEGPEAALQSQNKLTLLDFVERWWWSSSVMGALPKLQVLLASVTTPFPWIVSFLITYTTHIPFAYSSLGCSPYSCWPLHYSFTGANHISVSDHYRGTSSPNGPKFTRAGGEHWKIADASGSIDGDNMHKIATRWLVGQLKINLRPLWSPTIQTLGVLASTGGYGEEIWDVVFSELEKEYKDEMEIDEEASQSDEWEEEERTWRCPSAIKFIKTVHRWEGGAIISLEESTSQDRLDLANYEAQLLLALGGMPYLMDKHTRALVPLSLSMHPHRTFKAHTFKDNILAQLLSKLNNPKAAFRSQELHDLYTTLLSHPDRSLQSLALTCLLTFKEPHVLALEQSLRLFLDATKWRDEMTGFNFDSLNGELRARANRRDKKSAVLTLLSGCSAKELGTLVQLMLAPFEDCLDGGLENAHTVAGGKQRIGYLTFLADVLKNLGPKLLDYWPQLLRTTMVLLRDAQAHCKSSIVPVEEEVDESEEPTDEHPSSGSFHSSNWVPLLARENTQAPSGILDLFFTWSMEPRMTLFLVEYDSDVLPQVFSCLTAVNTTPRFIKTSNPESSSLIRDTAFVTLISYAASPGKTVSEKVKVDLLGIIKSTLPFVHALRDSSSEAYHSTYELVSSMFQSLRTRSGRVALVEVFSQLADLHEKLAPIAHIVTELNAYSIKRMEEPDFDRRLTAFSLFNEEGYKSLTCELWLPLIYNMLFFIQDPEELSIRSSASLSLKLLLLMQFSFDSVSSLSQLRPLLADGDDEANFFLNIYHIQTHRRTRALRRLADFSENIRSTTLSDLFMPLVGQFVESVATTDHLLVAESTENADAEAEAKADIEREAKKMARIEEAVTTRLLPSLLQYLEKRDEAEEAIRIPVAIGIARVTMHLPETYRSPQISKLIVALSQILRSKSQDVRDLTRETLCKIAIIVGPESLSLLIKELRSALTRGPQLHVLAFVAHSILVHVTTGDHAPASLLISQNAKFLKQRPIKKQYKKKTDFDIELKRDTAPDTDFYASNSFRFVAFGLEILITGFRRGRFDYADPEIISRLEPMSVVIGNTLYSQDGHVVTLGLKAAASIVKCPLRSVEKSLPVTQTALKSLAIMIRDCPAAKLQESDLTFLLEVIAPDLEEPERQAAVFSLLRTIIARKFVVPEIYDLMGKVAEILVTNQSSQVQELARSVLLQFLLDYPQGKGRLRTQLNALARNLDYVFDSGRKSVMEFLAAVISKFTDSIVDEYADMFFVAFVLRIANDDSTKCREMAAALIQQLLSRVGEERRKKLMAHAHNWAEQEEKQQLAGVAAQVYGLALDALHADTRPFMSDMATDLRGLIQRSAYKLNNESDAMDVDEDDKSATWQVPYHALTTLGKLHREFPEQHHSASTKDWASIYSHLLFPHAWVRLASCRLVGYDYQPGWNDITLAALADVTQKLCLQLRSTNLDDTLSTQVVKNLFYAGKMSKTARTKRDESGGESDAEDEGTPTENRATKALANPLAWMFSPNYLTKLDQHTLPGSIGPRTRKWYIHIGSIFRWFAAMTSHLPAPTLETFLPHILAPVYRIAEEETIKDTELDDLKTLTHELQALLQQRTGTTAFANVYSRIRQGVVRVRRERKIQRATQAATHPEAARGEGCSGTLQRRRERREKTGRLRE